MTATAAWHAINPKGRVPALLSVPGEIGGAPGLLTETPAIRTYLASCHPDAGLLPIEPAAVARCVEWLNWLSSNVHALSYGQIWRARRFTANEACVAGVEAQGRS